MIARTSFLPGAPSDLARAGNGPRGLKGRAWVLGNPLGRGARAAGLKEEGRQEPELRTGGLGRPELIGPLLDSS